MPSDPRQLVSATPENLRRLATLLDRSGSTDASASDLREAEQLAALVSRDHDIFELAAPLARLAADLLERVGRQPSEPS